MTRIYCVEDDNSIRELICYTLNASGFSAEGFECADDFFARFKESPANLVILDLMLPDTDGMAVLDTLRNSSSTKNIPVIILSAKSDRLDKLKGLDNGADDYITKPFDILELISRIKAVLRRSSVPEKPSQTINFLDISINIESHKVFVKGQEIFLTYKEFEILKLLIENKGKVITRSVLMDSVWGFDFEGETRTVDVHIRTLRQKLGECSQVIETVRNVGYRVTDNV